MKKTYLKPGAEYISFYSEEEITGLDLQTWANSDDSMNGNTSTSGNWGDADMGDGWT